MKEFETKEGTRYHFDFAYVNDFGNYTIDIYIFGLMILNA